MPTLNSKQFFLVVCDYISAAAKLAENANNGEQEDPKARNVVNRTFPIIQEQCSDANRKKCMEMLKAEGGYTVAFMELANELGLVLEKEV